MGKDLIAVLTALRQWGDRWVFGAGNEPLSSATAAPGGRSHRRIRGERASRCARATSKCARAPVRRPGDSRSLPARVRQIGPKRSEPRARGRDRYNARHERGSRHRPGCRRGRHRGRRDGSLDARQVDRCLLCAATAWRPRSATGQRLVVRRAVDAACTPAMRRVRAERRAARAPFVKDIPYRVKRVAAVAGDPVPDSAARRARRRAGRAHPARPRRRRRRQRAEPGLAPPRHHRDARDCRRRQRAATRPLRPGARR